MRLDVDNCLTSLHGIQLNQLLELSNSHFGNLVNLDYLTDALEQVHPTPEQRQARLELLITCYLEQVEPFLDSLKQDLTEIQQQPLHYLEVACVPNGLLMFDGRMYARTPNLLIPGKDTQNTPEHVKRTRVRLEPLASISDGWRCQKIVESDGEWKVVPRVLVEPME